MEAVPQHPGAVGNGCSSRASQDCIPHGGDPGLDLLEALPAELVAECFRSLELNDCIAVSHVSRAWRLAALADCTLWNHYRIQAKCPNIPSAVDALTTLLARSHPAPFYFVCDLREQHIPQAIHNLVTSNLYRLAELKLDDALQVSRLMCLDAPLLQRLTCYSRYPGASSVPPAQKGTWNAPRLESITLRGILPPTDCQPLTAVRSFHTFLSSEVALNISPFHVFPNLTSLEVNGITQADLPLLSPLPRALEKVILRAGIMQRAVDYSDVMLNVCIPCKIRSLGLIFAARFLEALALFARVHDGLWMLEIGDSFIRCRRLEGDTLWTVACFGDLSLSRERRFVLHLEWLAILELPLASFMELEQISHGAWNRQLPHLRSLILGVDFATDARRTIVRGLDTVPQTGIGMPSLVIVELGCADVVNKSIFVNWLTSEAPTLLLAVLDGHGTPGTLESIFVHTDNSFQLSHQDVAQLLELADRISIGKATDPASARLVFE